MQFKHSQNPSMVIEVRRDRSLEEESLVEDGQLGAFPDIIFPLTPPLELQLLPFSRLWMEHLAPSPERPPHSPSPGRMKLPSTPNHIALGSPGGSRRQPSARV